MSKRKPALSINTRSSFSSGLSSLSPLSADSALGKIAKKLEFSTPSSPTYTKEDKERFRSRIDRFTDIVLSKSTSSITVSNHQPTIPEKILLLALTDQGWLKPGIRNLDEILLWGVLAELVIKERITTYELKKKALPLFSAQRYGMDVISTEPTGDDLCDEVLGKLNEKYTENNSKRVATYLLEIRESFSKNIVSRVAHNLVNAGLLSTNRGVDLMVVNFEVYPVVDRTVKDCIRKDICQILTTIEDRYHIASISPSTPIEGLSPSLYALVALLYLHDDMMYREVLLKNFPTDTNAVAQLRHTSNEMIAQHEQWSQQRGYRRDASTYSRLYHITSEYRQMKKR